MGAGVLESHDRFAAVTDHAENIGVLSALEDPNSAAAKGEMGELLRTLIGRSRRNPKEQPAVFQLVLDMLFDRKGKLPDEIQHASSAAWAREISVANRNYEPGKFTTFIAYEWTAMPYGANLHRNVIFRGNSAPYPFTALDSVFPEDLWEWLETIRKKGFEALAIPHNGNASNGMMYDWITSKWSRQIGLAYATLRQENEPLSEIAQNKGTSETHPLLSPEDEFSAYEIFDALEASRHRAGRPSGSYLRDALSRGLILQRKLGDNPYKYGFVGGSDFHSGLSVSAQADFSGNDFRSGLGGGKPTREQARAVLRDSARSLRLTSGSLTGVWAESNTRESIYAALRRRQAVASQISRPVNCLP